MTPDPNWTQRMLMLLLLALLLPACASNLPTTASVPAAIPPLPGEARQPKTPSFCYPTCSQGLTRERESWQSSLTAPTSQGAPAKLPTIR